jgi:hypothetical protein
MGDTMDIIELTEKDGISDSVKLNRIYVQFREILNELRKKELPQEIIGLINHDIEDINSTSCIGEELRKLFKKKQTKILKILEKELKIVPKVYYRNLWLSLGISIFGIPLGMIIGLVGFGNIAFFSIGIPIGMCIGIVMGSEMDKKALKEGRQLNLIIKY